MTRLKTDPAGEKAHKPGTVVHFDPRAIRRLMLERGLDPTSTARRTRLTRVAISYLSRGMTEPRASTLARLATAFNVPVDDFFVRGPSRS